MGFARKFTFTFSPATSAPTLVSIVGNANNTVTVTFSQDILLSGNALNYNNWQILPPTTTGVVVTPTALTYLGNAVTLTTNEQTTGTTYFIVIPSGVTDLTGAYPYAGPFTSTFTGLGSSTPILYAQGIDAYTVNVAFTKPIVAAQALIASNWSIIPSLAISSVAQLNAFTFQLTTAAQSSGQEYVVRAQNMTDLALNPI